MLGFDEGKDMVQSSGSGQVKALEKCCGRTHLLMGNSWTYVKELTNCPLFGL